MAERIRTAPTRPTLFIDDLHEVEPGDVFRAVATTGSEVYSFAFTPHTTLKAINLLQRAYNKWAAGNRTAQGIRSRGKRGGHAASS